MTPLLAVKSPSDLRSCYRLPETSQTLTQSLQAGLSDVSIVIPSSHLKEMRAEKKRHPQLLYQTVKQLHNDTLIPL